MVFVSFASVPLYKIFCSVTGFGGTTQVSSAPPDESNISERQITVQFDSNVAKDLNWHFKPEILKTNVQIGEKKYISYLAQNLNKETVSGTAVFNVTPVKAGKYFNKIECFCFQEQSLKPGQRVNMPVLFYIDPEIEKDRSMNDVKTITLSYSFFKIDSQSLDNQIEGFYNQSNTVIQTGTESSALMEK
jgi:cytochrome c oxidase assembly protein subunit 11